MAEEQVPPRFVALAEAYATEADARHALNTDLAPGHVLGRYRGLWRLPTGALVHLFTDADPQWLQRSGWEQPEPGLEREFDHWLSGPEPVEIVTTNEVLTEEQAIEWIAEERRKWAAANPSLGQPVAESALAEALKPGPAGEVA